MVGPRRPTLTPQAVEALMEERIRGAFPGGPRRSGSSSPRTRPPRLQSVAEIEDRKARRTLEEASRRRRRRVVVGFVLAIVLAGGAGAYIGYASHRTPEEIVASQEHESARLRDLNISWQVNRTLLQLWKMEDVEAMRNVGLTR